MHCIAPIEGRLEIVDMQTDFKLLESIPDALLIASQAGDVVFANEGVGRLFGYAREELIAHGLNLLLPERFRRSHEQNIAAFARDPYVRPMGGGAIFYGRHKSGDEFPVEIYLSPLRRADELLVMAAIRDVSPRVKLEEELRRSRDDLDERVRVRTAELEETAKRLLSELLSRIMPRAVYGVCSRPRRTMFRWSMRCSAFRAKPRAAARSSPGSAGSPRNRI